MRGFTAGASHTIQSWNVMFGATLKPIRSARVLVGGQLRMIYSSASSLSLAPSDSEVRASSRGDGAARVTSRPVTVTPTGGTGPYTYGWTVLDDPRITATAPGMAATAFAAILENESIASTAQCVVTDSAGAVAACLVSVVLTRFGVSQQPLA